MLEELEPIALGELGLTPEQFGGYTIMEIDAMYEGYVRRQERLEDLFIINCALPTYRGYMGKKAPSYKRLTAHRTKRNKIGDIDEETQQYWREILQQGGKPHVEEHGTEAGD